MSKKASPCKTFQLTSEQINLLMKGELSEKELLATEVIKPTLRVTLNNLLDMTSRHVRQYVYASWFGECWKEFKVVDLETGEILLEKKHLSLKFVQNYLAEKMELAKVAVILFR